MKESTKYLVFLMVLGSFGFGILVADLTNYDLVNKQIIKVQLEYQEVDLMLFDQNELSGGYLVNPEPVSSFEKDSVLVEDDPKPEYMCLDTLDGHIHCGVFSIGKSQKEANQ